MKVYEIIHGSLYQRGRPRPAQWKELGEYELVVGLAGPPLDWIQRGRTRYLHYPIADGTRVPDLSVPLALVTATWGLEGARVLLYCNAGRNRSSLLSALVLIERGVHPAAAIEHIRRVRPNALANPAFVQYILSKNSQE